MAKILVAIPTKNRPRFVVEAINSVLSQTFSDFRVLVSDNCSEPAASAEVEAYVRSLEDPRVTYHRHSVDGGEYGQGRFFMNECRERYFTILHDDDWLEPDHLEYTLGILDSDPEVAFVGTNQYLIDGEGQRLLEMTREYSDFQGRDRYPEGRLQDPLQPLLELGFFSISGAVFRSEPVQSYGLVDSDCSGLYPFEFNVFLRVAERGLPAYYTPRRLVAYRWHDGSMRQTDGSTLNRFMVETLIKILEKRRFSGPAERKRRRLLSFNYRNYGYIQLVARDPGCYRNLARAVRLNPLSANLWAYGAFALAFPFLVRRLWGPRVVLVRPAGA